jgi:hypothetical protein
MTDAAGGDTPLRIFDDMRDALETAMRVGNSAETNVYNDEGEWVATVKPRGRKPQ